LKTMIFSSQSMAITPLVKESRMVDISGIVCLHACWQSISESGYK
jgi:hypothetical protein